MTVGELKNWLATQPDDREIKGFNHEFGVITNKIKIREDRIVSEVVFFSNFRFATQVDPPEEIQTVVIIS